MNSFFKQVKTEDEVDSSGSRPVLEHHRLLGTWVNTDESARGVVKVVVEEIAGKLSIHTFGGADSVGQDWGRTAVDTLYADSIRSHCASGFSAAYRLDTADVEVQANWNQGLLVLGSFVHFTDESKRANYFSREFFRQQD